MAIAQKVIEITFKKISLGEVGEVSSTRRYSDAFKAHKIISFLFFLESCEKGPS